MKHARRSFHRVVLAAEFMPGPVLVGPSLAPAVHAAGGTALPLALVALVLSEVVLLALIFLERVEWGARFTQPR
jgi:hypothetical protein